MIFPQLCLCLFWLQDLDLSTDITYKQAYKMTTRQDRTQKEKVITAEGVLSILKNVAEKKSTKAKERRD